MAHYQIQCFRRLVKRILVITARFPLPALGACEQDRFEGVKQLKRLGFEIAVVAKIFSFQPKEEIEKFSREFGIPVKTLPYENKFSLRKILNPLYWDGAAYEYSHKSMKDAVESEVERFRPDLIWVDYTYLWPLYSIFKKREIPIIVRSINFEPSHFLQEDGYSFLNLVKFLSKFAGEMITVKKNDFLFAITPKEERLYRGLGAKNAATLPLRGLAGRLKGGRQIKDAEVLNVFFAGSTYSVSHNRKALELIVKKVAPLAERKKPGKFTFHITGRKFPNELKSYLSEKVIYRGLINDWNSFTDEMDIAIVPSLYGAGMQQKIFEPLCLGIPTVASSRGLAGYPFVNGEHLLLAETPEDFVGSLLMLEDVGLRQKLSKNAYELASQVFSRGASDQIITKAINSCAR